MVPQTTEKCEITVPYTRSFVQLGSIGLDSRDIHEFSVVMEGRWRVTHISFYFVSCCCPWFDPCYLLYLVEYLCSEIILDREDSLFGNYY